MKTQNHVITLCACTLGIGLAVSAPAQLISNGSFEAGLSGWTSADQVGSDGTFQSQTGDASPVNAIPVPPPPSGSFAAMTDAQGPGSHVLYQDFTIPAGVLSGTLSFSLFLNNMADAFYVAPDLATLDFGTPALNQQARVDILTTAADPFSIAAADVIQNLYQTAPGDPLVSGYNDLSFDVSSLFAAHQGETLRLRFAAVDNVNIFNFGVDDVRFGARSDVPDVTGVALLIPLGVMVASHSIRRRIRPVS